MTTEQALITLGINKAALYRWAKKLKVRKVRLAAISPKTGLSCTTWQYHWTIQDTRRIRKLIDMGHGNNTSHSINHRFQGTSIKQNCYKCYKFPFNGKLIQREGHYYCTSCWARICRLRSVGRLNTTVRE